MKIRIIFPKPVVLLIYILLAGLSVFSQETEKGKKNLKNTLRINITNPLIFGERSIILGYERTIGKHQSFSLNLGQFSLPKLFSINTDSITGLTKKINSKGFSMSGDYRFYLANENKYNSPRGVYIGPYFSFNKFNRSFELSANTAAFTGDFNADLSLRIATLGFQLGYQFVFRNRLTLDMILFGPGISSYKVKAVLSTSLDPDQEAEVFKKINEVLKDKIPGYSLVAQSGTFEKTGSGNTTSAGYRYVVMVGFRF
jgi:hypothetical protein